MLTPQEPKPQTLEQQCEVFKTTHDIVLDGVKQLKRTYDEIMNLKHDERVDNSTDDVVSLCLCPISQELMVITVQLNIRSFPKHYHIVDIHLKAMN